MTATRSGKVVFVDANRVVIKADKVKLLPESTVSTFIILLNMHVQSQVVLTKTNCKCW